MTTELESRFDTAMRDLFRRAEIEAGYNPTRESQMLAEHRGLETARMLLHASAISEGFAALCDRDRVDLTVEALIHDHEEYHPLFTDEERALAWQRLEEHQYPPVIDPVEKFIGAFSGDVLDWSSEHDKYLGQAQWEEMRALNAQRM